MRTTVRNVAFGIAILAILIAIALFIAWMKLSLTLPNVANSTPSSIPLSSTPSANSIFTADFEGGNSQPGIGIYFGSWQIIDDGTGNHVFQNDIAQDWPGFSIGRSMSDGVIEYQVKYIDYDLSQDFGSGRVNLYFRGKGTNSDGYIFSLHPYVNRTELVYVSNSGWSPALDGSMSTILIQKNVWYTVRLEIKGTSISSYLDGTLLFTIEDDRFQTGVILLGIGPKTKVQFDNISVTYSTP